MCPRLLDAVECVSVTTAPRDDEKWFAILALVMPLVALLLLVESVRSHNNFGWVLFVLWIAVSTLYFWRSRRRKRDDVPEVD